MKGLKPDVEIYDTTLRDGSPGEGINFSATDKLRIAEKLDAFGVHYIEGGLRFGLGTFCCSRIPQG